MTNQEAEKNVVLMAINVLLASGYEILIQRSENWSKDYDAIVAELFAEDEDQIFLRKGNLTSFILCVYGNSPHEVIADAGVSLESVLKPVDEFAEATRARLEGLVEFERSAN
jgi:hypothetical protein